MVSVGNLTVGGTGKTPVVIWLARQLHRSGHTVAILSRGYGRNLPSQKLIVADGQTLTTTWQLAGDEPYLIAQKCPWAIVAVGNNRYDLGCWLLERFSCDCFILDDGYQHLSLHRDWDLVLIDALDVEGLNGVLPAGRLREPLSAGGDATSILLTRTELAGSSEPVLKRLDEALGTRISPVYLTTRLLACRHLGTGVSRSVTDLRGQRVLAFSGIGNGLAFRKSLDSVGLEVVEEIRYEDHVVYSAQHVEQVRESIKNHGIEKALTTEKDALKVQEWAKPEDPIWVVEMDIEFTEGKDQILRFLRELEEKV